MLLLSYIKVRSWILFTIESIVPYEDIVKKENNIKLSEHAEEGALLYCKNKDILHKCIIIVIQFHKNKGIQMSKPCKNCQLLIDRYNIKETYYSNEYGNIIRAKKRCK